MFGILGSVLGGLLSSSASHSAANQQANSAQQQLDFSKQVYQDQKDALKPWMTGGLQGQQAYNSLLGLGAAPAGFTSQVAAPGSMPTLHDAGHYQQSPGYQWQLQQGMDAAQSAAAARGGLGSGATLRDLTTYGQGLANQDYNNYLNRERAWNLNQYNAGMGQYDRNREDYQNYLNRLAGVGQSGQAAAGMQANAAGNYGTNALNALGSIGDARAAGTVGAANAWGNAINNGIAAYGYMQGNPSQGRAGNVFDLFGKGGFGGFN